MAVSFIGEGNLRTRRKPPTCWKSLTNFIICCIEYASSWAGFVLTTLVVIGIDCICSIRSRSRRPYFQLSNILLCCIFSTFDAEGIYEWRCFFQLNPIFVSLSSNTMGTTTRTGTTCPSRAQEFNSAFIVRFVLLNLQFSVWSVVDHWLSFILFLLIIGLPVLFRSDNPVWYRHTSHFFCGCDIADNYRLTV